MYVVPLNKDVIVTADGYTYRVVEYTNFKEAGPAVYVLEKGVKTPKLVYFSDIISINRVKVEYSRQTKLLKTFGHLDRPIHLPQPDDEITVLTDNISLDDSPEVYEVLGLKLKSRTAGINHGLVVHVDGHPKFIRLTNILDIRRSFGASLFDRSRFRAIYKHYMGAQSASPHL